MSRDLTARLALLANETPEFDGDRRVLSGADRFAALIHLIDQTVIPAVLEVEDEAGVLLLDVSGRRLCRLPGAVEDLTSDDAEAIAMAVGLMTAFADRGDGPLRVRERASDETDTDPAQSVSIQTLADAAGRPLINPGQPPLHQLQMRLGARLLAGLRVTDGAVTDTLGDADSAAPLNEAVAGLADLAGDAPSLLVFETTDGEIRGAALEGAEALIFAVEDVDAATLLAFFDASFGIG